MPRFLRVLPNERTRDFGHSLFGSGDENGNEYDYSSPPSTRASSHERVDDGARRRHTETRGTGEGTTVVRDEIKPWRLPEQIINRLSHETIQHHRIHYSMPVNFMV